MDARSIVNAMYDNDEFSKWLGIKILEVEEGYCKLGMTVREEMTNGFGIAHGGISFSFADSALAFASNSRGRKAVSIEVQISHTNPIYPGDELTATTTEDNLTNRLGRYTIRVHNQDDILVALFKGTVFRKEAWSQVEDNI